MLSHSTGHFADSMATTYMAPTTGGWKKGLKSINTPARVLRVSYFQLKSPTPIRCTSFSTASRAIISTQHPSRKKRTFCVTSNWSGLVSQSPLGVHGKMKALWAMFLSQTQVGVSRCIGFGALRGKTTSTPCQRGRRLRRRDKGTRMRGSLDMFIQPRLCDRIDRNSGPGTTAPGLMARHRLELCSP